MHEPPPALDGADPAGDRERRALAGDPDAWGALVAVHQGRVLAYLLSRGWSLPDALDLAQQTWVNLLVAARAGKLGRLDLPGLALRTAYRLGVDRHRHIRHERPAAEAEVDIAGEDGGPEAERLERERDRRLAEAVARLSPTRRQMVVLRYQEGLSCEEIARRLAVSVQHVRQTLYEARLELRAGLGSLR